MADKPNDPKKLPPPLPASAPDLEEIFRHVNVMEKGAHQMLAKADEKDLATLKKAMVRATGRAQPGKDTPQDPKRQR